MREKIATEERALSIPGGNTVMAGDGAHDSPSRMTGDVDQEYSMDTFFATLRPPEYYLESLERAAAFIARHQHGQTYPVILVSSGGTTVPLERRMVRFMDNFSGGTRGATSAEHFLRAGAAVIFLHRQYSLRPFSRHYRHADETVLEMFEAELDDQGNAVRGSDVPQVRPQYREQLLGDLRESQQVPR